MQTPLHIVPTAMPAPIAESAIPQIQTIVVGYSPDETGTIAFRHATALASCFKAKLVAVRSIQRPNWGVVDVSYEMLAEDFLNQETQRMMEAGQRLLQGHAVECSFKTAFGGPVDLLMAEVESENADLVVLGCHGTDGLEALLLGSVSRSMALLCSCPVLVLPGGCLEGAATAKSEEFLEAGPILFASDVRYTDMRTAEYAKKIATQLSRGLIAMHVLPNAKTDSPNNVVWEEDFAKEQLRILLGEAPGENVAQIVVKRGEAVREILAEAARQHAALIVAGGGTHHAGIDHIPWEALACLLRQATCPVLVVPANSK